MEQGWNRTGKGLEQDWNRTGTGLEQDWSTIGIGLEHDWNMNEVCLGVKTTRQQSLGIEPPMSIFSNYTGNRTHDSGVSVQILN